MVHEGFLVREACIGVLVGGARYLLPGVHVVIFEVSMGFV